MATAFPLSTYPLSDRTRLLDQHNVRRDVMDDGSMYIRQMSAESFKVIRCVFNPLDESTARTFWDYLITNKATEFTMSFSFQSPQQTYQGYIWSDPSDSVSQGTLHTISFDFRGEIV